MKKVFCVLALLILVTLIALPALAQGSTKIAVVDTAKAIRESIWGRKATQELENEIEEWRGKAEERNKEISVLESELAKQRSLPGDTEEAKRLEKEISDRKAQSQALVQEGNARLEQKRQELLAPIVDEMRKTIKKLVKEENYDIILERQPSLENSNLQLFVYLNPELDITSQVMAVLDATYKERASIEAESDEIPSDEEGEGSRDE